MHAQLLSRGSAPSSAALFCRNHSDAEASCRGRCQPRADAGTGVSSAQYASRTRHRTPFGVAAGSRWSPKRTVHCQAEEDSQGNRISSTLSGLDALLGIDPEIEAKKKVCVSATLFFTILCGAGLEAVSLCSMHLNLLATHCSGLQAIYHVSDRVQGGGGGHCE